MNKRIKLLPIFIVLLLLGTMFTFSAFATGEAPGGDTPAVSTPDPGPVTPDPGPVTPDPGPGDTPVTSDPVTPSPGDTPVTSDPVTPEPDPDPGVEPENPVVSDPVSSNPSGGYVDSYTNEDGYYYYDEDTMVENIEGYAGNVSDYTTLYDTSDFNESALKEQKWDNITIDTSKAPSDKAAMDFSAIKDNTSSGDDGEWILYTGYLLIGLSICGILYYIIATATYKKRVNALASRPRSYNSERSTQQRSRSDYGDSEYPTSSDYNQRYRSKNRRYTSDNRSYAERKRSKADTAEIYIK